MKVTLFIMICSTVLCCCISNAAKPGKDAKSNTTEMTDTVNYSAEVLPILQKKCSPCHFAGGKMYEKMPFDNSETILSHESGVLKRFSDKSEATLIKEFIQQRNKVN
jgi:hypothetical protein